VALSFQRSEFEQQLCAQLHSLSEVAEALADRVLELEARLTAVEGQQVSSEVRDLIPDQTAELLSASEAKVTELRSRLAPAEILSIAQVPQDSLEDQEQVEVDEQGCDSSPGESDETTYVDDPQIDLLSA
tara:strand:- start:10 stop:399 length:390 start_codon:yes stop_codon:yes gene_type:complete